MPLRCGAAPFAFARSRFAGSRASTTASRPPRSPRTRDDGATRLLALVGVAMPACTSDPIPVTSQVKLTTEVPPPISGGTLHVSASTNTAYVSDWDRDRIFGVDLASQQVTAEIALADGDEPGRIGSRILVTASAAQ